MLLSQIDLGFFAPKNWSPVAFEKRQKVKIGPFRNGFKAIKRGIYYYHFPFGAPSTAQQVCCFGLWKKIEVLFYTDSTWLKSCTFNFGMRLMTGSLRSPYLLQLLFSSKVSLHSAHRSPPWNQILCHTLQPEIPRERYTNWFLSLPQRHSVWLLDT